MTCTEALGRLESLGNEQLRKQNHRRGVGENQFGVTMGEIRAIAKEIKSDHPLALELWATGNFEARQLATLIMKPKLLSDDEIEKRVLSQDSAHSADYFNSYVLKAHPSKEALRQKWMLSDNPQLGRAAWSLTTERVGKNPEGLDLVGLLDRIEKELATAHEFPQWTMNYCLAEIGIRFPEHRDRALAIGEKLGVYRDYPVSKGCTSPFAPIWINAMVSRQ